MSQGASAAGGPSRAGQLDPSQVAAEEEAREAGPAGAARQAQEADDPIAALQAPPSAQAAEGSWRAHAQDASALLRQSGIHVGQVPPRCEALAERQLCAEMRGAMAARARDPNSFHRSMQAIYGRNYDHGKVEGLRQRALRGDTSWLPSNFRFVDPKTIPGASGAYSPRDGGTVLLSRDLLRGDPADMTAVFLEETGHHVDALLQLPQQQFERAVAGDRRGIELSDRRDAAGDEGARMAGYLRTGGVPKGPATDAKGSVRGLGDVEFHTVQRDEVGRIKWDDGEIEMHPSWRSTSLGPAFSGNTIDLNRVTPAMVKGLSANDLQTFMGIVEKWDFDVEVYNGAGDRKSGFWPFTKTSELNGGTAFAAQMWASGDSEAFARVFAAAPDRVTKYLTGNGSRVLTAENLALIMKEMRSSEGKYTPKELDALGDLVQKYLERNAGKDPDKCRAAMEEILTAVRSSGLPNTPENAGVVAGTITAGMLKHFDKIKASDEDRIRIVNNLMGFAGAVAGNFGPIGDAVSAGIAGLQVIYGEIDKPRNYQEYATRLQGAVQLEWMQNPPKGWSRDDRQDALHWLYTTILNNGQR